MSVSPGPLKKALRIDAKWAIFLLAVFAFRLGFGLCSKELLTFDDSVQDYLIGLKSYTTHTWPYFGSGTFVPSESPARSQVAGAGLGLFTAAALRIWPNALSPFVFLNLFNFFALGFLGWYCSKRLPGLSPWFIFTWIYIAPWFTQLTTQIINQSFMTFGSALFFVGFMETIPGLRVGALKMGAANFIMAFGVFWCMNFHFSWVVLGALAAVSLFAQIRGKIYEGIPFFILGAIPPLVLVIPTYLKYGIHQSGSVSALLVPFNVSNFKSYFTVLLRFLSFGSFEMPRFLGDHTQERVAFLLNAPLLAVPGFVLWILGWAQVLGMTVLLFVRNEAKKDWRGVKLLLLGTSLLVWASFWFTVRHPAAHRFYLVAPLSMVYFLYCCEWAQKYDWMKTWGKVFLVLAVVFQIGYAVQNLRIGRSHFFQIQGKVNEAIRQNDYRILGDRPDFYLY